MEDKLVGITVKLLESEKNDFKKACQKNKTDMAKQLAQMAVSFTKKVGK